jgi:hypothetical protein
MAVNAIMVRATSARASASARSLPDRADYARGVRPAGRIAAAIGRTLLLARRSPAITVYEKLGIGEGLSSRLRRRRHSRNDPCQGLPRKPGERPAVLTPVTTSDGA